MNGARCEVGSKYTSLNVSPILLEMGCIDLSLSFSTAKAKESTVSGMSHSPRNKSEQEWSWHTSHCEARMRGHGTKHSGSIPVTPKSCHILGVMFFLDSSLKRSFIRPQLLTSAAPGTHQYEIPLHLPTRRVFLFCLCLDQGHNSLLF